jgi:hypothetical protein
MMKGDVEQIEGDYVEFARHSAEEERRQHDLVAPCSGLFVEAGLETSDHVVEGQSLGHIIRDDTLKTEEIVSPVDGWLWAYGCRRPDCDVALPPQHPYAEEGDNLATVVEG